MIFEFRLTLSGTIEAPTLEEAKQKLDYAINFADLLDRGIEVLDTHENVNKPYESTPLPR